VPFRWIWYPIIDTPLVDGALQVSFNAVFDFATTLNPPGALVDDGDGVGF